MQIYELRISKIISIFSSFALAKGFRLFAANPADSSYVIHNNFVLLFAGSLRSFQLYRTQNPFCACLLLLCSFYFSSTKTAFLAFFGPSDFNLATKQQKHSLE